MHVGRLEFATTVSSVRRLETLFAIRLDLQSKELDTICTYRIMDMRFRSCDGGSEDLHFPGPLHAP